MTFTPPIRRRNTARGHHYVGRYYDRCVDGGDDGDPREALVQLIAVAGAAIDAMGRDA